MENIRNHKIHHEEVNDIFQKIPNRFFGFSALSIVLTVIILFLLSIFFTYEESELLNLNIDIITPKIDTTINTNKEVYAIVELDQSKYGMLSDSTNIELSFEMYPKKTFGTINAILIKSDNDEIQENGLVNTIIKLPVSRKSNLDSIISYKKGMKAIGKIVYSEKLIINKIFE